MAKVSGILRAKKTPLFNIAGEDRDGVYGKENRDTMLLVTARATHCLQRR